MQPIWYSIPFEKAESLIKDGLTVHVFDQESREEYRGVLDDVSTGAHTFGFWIEEPDACTYHKFSRDMLIFQTNDRQLRMILPGELVFTINLV